MKRAVLVVTLVAASSGVASAGGYIGLGIGTSPALAADADNRNFEADGRSARLIGGFRFGRFSVEGAIGGFDVGMQLEANGTYYPTQVRQGSISGRYNLPLSDGFEAFGRFGVQRTQLNLDGEERFDATGNGFVLGVGIEYRLSVAGASLWVDYQYGRASLDGELTKTSLSARMWTLGATIGF